MIRLIQDKNDFESFFEHLSKNFQDSMSAYQDFVRVMEEKKKKQSERSASLFGKTGLYIPLRNEYDRVLMKKVKDDKVLRALLSDTCYNAFYKELYTTFIEMLNRLIETGMKEAKKTPSFKLFPLSGKEEAVLAILSGKFIVDETMPPDGKTFYAYKNGSFYRVEEGVRPVIVDFNKLTAKKFFILSKE